MSAQELIKQIATLPPAERALFENLFRSMTNKNGHQQTPAQQGHWPDFSHRLHQIYGTKVASDSQVAIHEERGDR